MNKEFKQYVYARIEKVLVEDKEYMELQSRCVSAQRSNDVKLSENLSDQMETRAEELCYKQGFNDAMQLMLKGTN